MILTRRHSQWLHALVEAHPRGVALSGSGIRAGGRFDFARFRANAALSYFDYAPLAERSAREYARAVRQQSGAVI